MILAIFMGSTNQIKLLKHHDRPSTVSHISTLSYMHERYRCIHCRFWFLESKAVYLGKCPERMTKKYQKTWFWEQSCEDALPAWQYFVIWFFHVSIFLWNQASFDIQIILSQNCLKGTLAKTTFNLYVFKTWQETFRCLFSANFASQQPAKNTRQVLYGRFVDDMLSIISCVFISFPTFLHLVLDFVMVSSWF
jgi:hypothetical protein